MNDIENESTDNSKGISRRYFVRLMCGVPVALMAPPSFAALSGESLSGKNMDPSGILVLAESFRDHGGWVLNTQYYEQMGGNYLMAHGSGVPVGNARTRVRVSEPGNYYLWVRTKNWCPGDWTPPGRFQVKIDGKLVEKEFGTEGDWGWEFGGEVAVGKSSEIELEDLTGFDGRCDALYFTKSQDITLPANADDWIAWRDRKLGFDIESADTKDFDVVIVGGGIAGCAAALAAASQELRVALVNDRPVFGGNASGEIRVHTIGITGKGDKILSKINTPVWDDYNGDDDSLKDDAKRQRALDAVSNIEQFKGYRACALDLNGQRIENIAVRQSRTGEYLRFRAPTFVDCTGDGWIGYWAGAEYRYGREAHTEFDEAWPKHGDLWSPDEPDNRVMGTSLLWNTEDADEKSSFPSVPWAKDVAKSYVAIRAKWFWEYGSDDLDQIQDAEAIRDHMFRAIYGSFSNAKKDPANSRLKIKWVGFVGGKRESRRLIGDHIFSMKDATDKVEFPDAVVEEVREIDVHYQSNLKGEPLDFLSRALFLHTDGMYYIPFRSLYSKNVDNLMMAGRCFSCSHVGLGGPRIQNTTGQMGIATGYAASLCKKYAATPRQVYKQHITELRGLIGYEDSKGEEG